MKTETKEILKRLQAEANLYHLESLRKELLLDAKKTIDGLEIENIGYGYAIQTLRRKCGLSNDGDSVDCQEIYVYISRLQKQLEEININANKVWGWSNMMPDENVDQLSKIIDLSGGVTKPSNIRS